MDIEPPVQERCKTLFQNYNNKLNIENDVVMIEECVLPVIDLDPILNVAGRKKEREREREREITCMGEAARELGFFRVVNHGIPEDVLENLYDEQKKLFHQPFSIKSQKHYMNLSVGSYRWGNLKATCPNQFPWSEAFHISVADISKMDHTNPTFRSSIEVYAKKVERVARRLCEVLASNLNINYSNYFEENCPESSSYVRLNRYPPCPCPYSSQVFGLIPHTDTDFLTVVYQDQVGGLQLKKNGQWFQVKPTPKALVINIGDLFQAFSNGVYKSVEHRVVAPIEVERLSTAYFFCPSYDAIIQSYTNHLHPPIYRNFSFREYKHQIQRDVEATGDKVGLSSFKFNITK